MSVETENSVKAEQENEEATAPVIDDKEDEEVAEKDLIPDFYSQHGGDPRDLDIESIVLISGLPTDFVADPYDQFVETIKNILKIQHKLDVSKIARIIRIPNLDRNPADQEHALRALISFSEKTQMFRMLARSDEFSKEGMLVEHIEHLPADALEIGEDDALLLGDLVMADENNEEDDVVIGGEDEVDEMMEEDDEGHDEHEEDLEGDIEEDEEQQVQSPKVKTEIKEESEEVNDKKGADDKKDARKSETPKKKVYEDEDEKAPFEMFWDGAPEFQWRLCENPRDEKKLIIDNILWADMNNVFIYRTIQKATSVDINFPTRFNSEGNRSCHGKLTLFFPGFVPIMDEALKHLVYFRSGDGRRIKVFLPQTTVSLKRKEEFEGKLGRVIKPTQRMMELVVKILPEGYAPTLDEACAWFPYQAVIGCEVVNDEMGKPCAIVKFETAEEAVAAHAGKSFVQIITKGVKKEKDADGNEKEVTKDVKTFCNVFMRGVEAHFGSLLTFFDQKKKAAEQRSNRKRPAPTTPQKRPAGSTIRGPVQKKRATSPKRAHIKEITGPRGGGGRGGGSRLGGRGGASGGGPRRSSPPPRPTPRGGPRGGSSRGGRGGSSGGRGSSTRGSGGSRSTDRTRSAPRSSSYRNNDSFSSSSSQRGPARAAAFTSYGYTHFENRYNNDRPSVDPFGRPVYGNSAFASSSSSFHRGDDRSGGFSSSSSFDRRRY